MMTQSHTPKHSILALLFALLLPWGAAADIAAAPGDATHSNGAATSVGVGEEEQPAIDFEELKLARRARQANYPVGARVSRYLVAAQKASDDEGAEASLALLDRLRMNRLNAHERAYVYRLKAYLAYGNGDYDLAIKSFQDMIAEEVMAPDIDNRARFAIAQIHASLQQWPETIAALDVWFHWAEEPNPLAYYLLGISNFQLHNLDEAIANTEKAIDLSEEPPESWLQLLSALFVQKEDYASATPILEELVMKFPKKQYWEQLSLIYGARDDYSHSLAVQQVAYLQGLLTEDKELRRLARSYLYADLPYPAAKVLEKGLGDGTITKDASAYELLANSWIAAREYDRSLAPLTTAAELAEDGKLLVRLGQVHLQREEWGKAAERLQEALDKGGLDNPGEAQLLLGIAYYNDARIGPARSAFARAREHQEAKAEADRWILHIETEAEKSQQGLKQG